MVADRLGVTLLPDFNVLADPLNSRPRKTLGWRTPAEVLDEHLTAAA